MDIKKVAIENIKDDGKKGQAGRKVKIGKYDCTTTSTPNLFKINREKGGYVVRCNYGRCDKIDEKLGKLKTVSEVTLRVVETISEGKKLLQDAERIRYMRRDNINCRVATPVKRQITLDDVIEAFKKDKKYQEMSSSYQIHYDNYFRHFSDFMGHKDPKAIRVEEIEAYYDYELKYGNLDNVKRDDEGKIIRDDEYNEKRRGLSVNTLPKHKTALKELWKYMIRKGCYDIEVNYPLLSEIPKVEIEIDGKKIKTRKIQRTYEVLSLDQLNYTLNDAIQYEADRSLVLLIALGAICGLRRSEAAALKIGRYYHNELMMIGEEMWQTNNFSGIRNYYERHDELILIDEAFKHLSRDELGFPKNNIIRMVGKPKVLDEIVTYAMEQRQQLAKLLGVDIVGSDRLYLPLQNMLQQNMYCSQKITRKWNQYQIRRNQRMSKKGLEPIPIIRFHDLRHTHASLLSESGIPVKEISRNMGHLIPEEGQVTNTTTKVYIHDRLPDRKNIIEYWDKNIHIEWDKALRIDGSYEGWVAVNGSGHLVVKEVVTE